MQSHLGQLVGYHVRFDKKVSQETKINFVTDGMLLREAIIDKDLKSYKIIVLDEAHERTVNSDVLLALLKEICDRRHDLKIVIMSATLEIHKF